MKKSQVIAIDGPSGSGKSTVAEEVARKMHYIYVNTGALYRAIGMFCRRENVDVENEAKVLEILPTIHLDYHGKDEDLVSINGIDFTQEIKLHEASAVSSKISAYKGVRDFLLHYQRKLAEKHFCVMEGRDIGTVVFPDAFCKIFLTASLEVRAQRRFEQLQLQKKAFTLEQVKLDISERDKRDMNRAVAPLKQAEDALLLDSSNQGIHAVTDEICAYAKTLRAR